MRKFAVNATVGILALAVGLMLAEATAQFYAAKIVKQGKLFQPDDRLGWSVLPNLDLTRLNHDGNPWHITTDQNGMRGPSKWADTDHQRLLIVGDSFVFGEGVDLEQRFDTLLAKQVPDLSIMNIGVMGYGTDQSLIKMRPYSKQLRPGDVLLIFTYSNDFFDISSTRQSGRSKPWFEWKNGELTEHQPKIGLIEVIRDRSFLMSRLATTFNTDRREKFKKRVSRAGDLYERIVVHEVAALLKRGVSVVVAHHGDKVFDFPFDVSAVFASVCKKVTSCVALDPKMGEHPAEEVFLTDGHWAPGGHKVVGELIAQHLISARADKSEQNEAISQRNGKVIEVVAPVVPAAR